MMFEPTRNAQRLRAQESDRFGRRPKVIIADDQKLVAQGLAKLLEHDFAVVEIVDDGNDLPAIVRRRNPDLVLIDVTMPGLTGLEVARVLKEETSSCKVIVISVYAEPEFVREALHAGASGYVLKRSAPSELVEAMWSVFNGSSYVSPALAKDALTFLYPRRGLLTDRQREVLRLVASGKSAREIAAELQISVKTAQFHRASIMKKLGKHSTADLTRYALQHGFSS